MWCFLTSFLLQNATSILDDPESISSGQLCCAPASSAFISIGYIKTCCSNVIIHFFLFLSSLHHPFHQTLLPCNIPPPPSLSVCTLLSSLSLVVGDGRVYSSPSSDGGQWPWGRLGIRWAGLCANVTWAQDAWSGKGTGAPSSLPPTLLGHFDLWPLRILSHWLPLNVDHSSARIFTLTIC